MHFLLQSRTTVSSARVLVKIKINNQASSYIRDLIALYVSNRALRSQTAGLLAVPTVSKSRVGGRSFSYWAPLLWRRIAVYFFKLVQSFSVSLSFIHEANKRALLPLIIYFFFSIENIPSWVFLCFACVQALSSKTLSQWQMATYTEPSSGSAGVFYLWMRRFSYSFCYVYA